MQRIDYAMVVEPLAPEDGGGFLASVPDLPGCASDGETPEEAMSNLRDAIAAWIEEARATGRPVPAPRIAAAAEGARV
jgi:predicted RNase H-like HicB family nuclease